eukprot:gene19373-27437_t
MIEGAKATGTDRIELYTEEFAHQYGLGNLKGIEPYTKAAILANDLNLGINAGHDLSLDNIKFFKENIPSLLEVSIGHALISEALYLGLDNVFMDVDKTILFSEIKEIILQSRQRVFRIANSVLLETYWQIGKLIIEDEQQGSKRAEYGKAVLKTLAKQLTFEFGKGFDESNLRNMRAFYRAFPIRDALRHELSWTHY